MSDQGTEDAIDIILKNDESRMMHHVNQLNINPIYRWSPSEVREIAEVGLTYIHYVQKLRRERKVPG